MEAVETLREACVNILGNSRKRLRNQSNIKFRESQQ